ncbi:MAG: hypothetical protein OHK0053_08670 [Microscillaceae bacterium]
MQNLWNEIIEKTTGIPQKFNKSLDVVQHMEAIEIGTSERDPVWQMDKVRLFHYRTQNEIKVKTPVLISYALINRYYMMDLQPDRSLIRKLLSLGLDMYVLDTGYPTRNERYLTMNDYINVYIDGAVDFIRESRQIPALNLMGICQGGTFSVIYSALHPQKIKNLITLVTPVDFSTNDGLLFRWARHMDADAIVEGFGGLVPGTFLDMGFQLLKPMLKVRKQKNLYESVDDEDKLLNFLRMEKWINDLPDQAGECYRQFIKDLYQQNKLIKNELVLDGQAVHLKNLTMPALTIYASEDHLVPPSSTKPLNEAIGSKDKQLYEFPGGHIGVFTGRRSQAELGPTIFEWLATRDQSQPVSLPTETASIPEAQQRPEKKILSPKPENQGNGIAKTQQSPAPVAEKADSSPSEVSDDLKKINGIGPTLEEKLHAQGLRTFAQLAQLTNAQLEALSQALGFSLVRLQKLNLAEQARQLLALSE